MKKFLSFFFGINLVVQLISMGVDILFICGFIIISNVCVVIFDVMQLGFWVMVVGDVCVDLGSEMYYVNLMDFGVKYGDVVEIEIVLLKIKEIVLRKRQLVK